MTEFELNTLLIMSAEKSGDILEFWVSVSFAVIVASFFISQQTNYKIFKLMKPLYLLASLFFASIYVGAGMRANYYYEQLIASGYETHFFGGPVSMATLYMAVFLWFSGTGATLYYMAYCAKKMPQSSGNREELA